MELTYVIMIVISSNVIKGVSRNKVIFKEPPYQSSGLDNAKLFQITGTEYFRVLIPCEVD